MPIPELVLLLDDRETMRRLKVGADKLESLVAGGDLPPIYIHAKRRFLPQDVETLAKILLR